jgi:hypothetical protein
MADVKMPRTFKVSAKATAAARAARDPNLKAPATAKVDTDKNGVVYKRWVETGSIEFAYREPTADGSQVVYIVGIKMRPGEPNQNKIGWFRMKVHPDIAEGNPVSAEVEGKFGWLTERSLVALVSLIDVTGFTPKPKKNATGQELESELSGSLLETLFPLKAQKTKSPVIGKSSAVKIVQKKNDPKFAANGRENQDDAELFLPAAPIPGLPAQLQ